MDEAFEKGAVKRCASELSRAIWYYRAWKALQEVERHNSANFIHLAELAMGDQMITHATKVLSINVTNGKFEEGGFWALYKSRQCDVDLICLRLGVCLDPIRKVGASLKLIRDKTHFHLDREGVLNPKFIWQEANITHDQFDIALSTTFAIIGELHFLINGTAYEAWQYDGSDAKLIAQHADQHDLLFRERHSAPAGWPEQFGD